MAQLAYILAASHSGSTLLAMLLGSHRETCTVGELKAMSLGDPERYPCSCGELIKSCPFWNEVSARMAHRGMSFTVTDAGTNYGSGTSRYTRRLLKPLYRRPFLEAIRDAALRLSPSWRRRLPELHARNAALVETICDITGARIVVDSSKIALRLKYLFDGGLDIKVVRLIRDGRAVALTYMNPGKYAGRMTDGSNGSFAQVMPMKEAAYRWRRSNEEAECLLTELDPAQWTELRYEEYCADPTATMNRVFEALELDPSEATRDFRSVEHHVVGNMMRLDTTSAVSLDERWRDVLTPEDINVFDRVAGDLNRRYGYT